MRARIHEALEAGLHGSPAARAVEWSVLTLIVANVAAFGLEHLEVVRVRAEGMLHAFEAGSVGLFTAEYLLRLWACTADERRRHPVFGRLRTAIAPLLLLDLAAIAPFWIELAAGWMLALDLRALRLVRAFRLVRALRASRFARLLHLSRFGH